MLPALADEASCDTPCCLHGGTQTEHVNIGNGAVASSPPYVHSAHQHLPTLVLIPSSHSPSLLKWHTQKQPIRAHRDLQIRGGGGGSSLQVHHAARNPPRGTGNSNTTLLPYSRKKKHCQRPRQHRAQRPKHETAWLTGRPLTRTNS